jgi:PmbA protein
MTQRLGQLGSRPFDGEGVRARRSTVIQGGVFSQFLFDSYYARCTGRRTTGNASCTGDSINRWRQLDFEAGNMDPAEIVRSVDDGLYLTGMMGFGINRLQATSREAPRGSDREWRAHPGRRDQRLGQPERNAGGC